MKRLLVLDASVSGDGGGCGRVAQTAVEGDAHTRGAETTLGTMEACQACLYRMEAGAGGAETFDGGDGAAIKGAEESEAGIYTGFLHAL